MKIKIILFVCVVILVCILAIFIQKERISDLRAENDRISANLDQMLAGTQSQLSLILTLKELLMIDSLRIDSLSGALKIRPKTIIRYIEISKTIHDTVKVPVFIYPEAGRWVVADSGRCWFWQGEVFIENDSLTVNRLRFDYSEKVKEFFFWEREKQFLFLRYGKKRYYHKIISNCGQDKINVFTINKGKN